ncbi:DUF805 domain-containing protein [Staphylococcus sp. ACRSN]|uniref:DUF805 domain-containing protein n=1 Tax=Staphylococcus sp. ACRSN TaxID=2918214 RepID=UPI001EF3116D|nr:DUF805 domain-containing protein [Staphylococcus sp. ACRSN]MCG7338193.1 DUF805 domain-containing protein [Staphylococcus sp. ACRSN]
MERKIGFVEAFKLFWKQYVNFKGRSRRSEYWFMTLWHLIFMVPAFIVNIIGLFIMIFGISVSSNVTSATGLIIIFVSSIYIFIYGLATLIPNYAIYIRRFHDTGRSMLIPLIFLGIYIVTYSFILVFNFTDPDYINGSTIITIIIIYVLYFVMGIYNLVICCLDSERKMNKYGQSHKYGSFYQTNQSKGNGNTSSNDNFIVEDSNSEQRFKRLSEQEDK